MKFSALCLIGSVAVLTLAGGCSDVKRNPAPESTPKRERVSSMTGEQEMARRDAAAAKSTYDYARKQYIENKGLAEKNLVTPAELAASEKKYKEAEEAYYRANNRVEEMAKLLQGERATKADK